jgi:general stress protein 26
MNITAYSRVEDSPMAELWDKIRHVRVALVSTVRQDGTLTSRPLVTLEHLSPDILWFATSVNSRAVTELLHNPQIALCYAAPDKDLYVMVSGQARVVHDPAMARELWNITLQAWWPNGPEDPELRLIEVHPTDAEYWHDRKPKALQFAQIAAAALSGTRPENIRDNEKLTF